MELNENTLDKPLEEGFKKVVEQFDGLGLHWYGRDTLSLCMDSAFTLRTSTSPTPCQL